MSGSERIALLCVSDPSIKHRATSGKESRISRERVRKIPTIILVILKEIINAAQLSSMMV